jgi:hypothetical protein
MYAGPAACQYSPADCQRPPMAGHGGTDRPRPAPGQSGYSGSVVLAGGTFSDWPPSILPESWPPFYGPTFWATPTSNPNPPPHQMPRPDGRGILLSRPPRAPHFWVWEGDSGHPYQKLLR